MASWISLLVCFTLLIAYSSLFAEAWRLQDTYNGNTWQQGMWLETVSRLQSLIIAETEAKRYSQRTTNSEYVQYLSKNDAVASGLIRSTNRGQIRLGVDFSNYLNTATGLGRKSVRLRTNKAYNANTLVIGDFAHMPANVCGVWPSFWMVGPKWPTDGEIDIIEGVNQMDHNQITIHTKPGCLAGLGSGGQSGAKAALPADCGQGIGDLGCGVNTVRNEAWGSGFNAAGGGVYAMLWTSNAIKIWHWKQNEVPRDVKGSNPNPDRWGVPVANWNGCDFGKLMNNMNIVRISNSLSTRHHIWIVELICHLRSSTQHFAGIGQVTKTFGIREVAVDWLMTAHHMSLRTRRHTPRRTG
jgi:hypothetical protein